MSTILTDTEQSTQKCDHIHRVDEWGVEMVMGDARFFVKNWDCLNCGETLSEPIERKGSVHEHTEFVVGCFACKAKTVAFGVGDAAGHMVSGGWTKKKWDGELQAYRDAKSQGIQPKTTRMKDIRRAVEISNQTGRAFDASRKNQ